MTGIVLPCELPLHRGFLPGSSVTIYGCVHDKADRFIIDLICAKENRASDIALHLNPRLKEEVVVRNSKKDSVWGPEDRRGCQPFKAGALFELKITCETNCFRVIVNQQTFTDFAMREIQSNTEKSLLTSSFVTHLGAKGDISVIKIIYTTHDVILEPSSMFWRQIGGHLRKVESAGGVTWGIGFDDTAWVYTGGSGGPYMNSKQRETADCASFFFFFIL